MRIDAIMMAYGTFFHGAIYTEQAALEFFARLREKQQSGQAISGWKIINTWMEGNHESGKVWATLETTSKEA